MEVFHYGDPIVNLAHELAVSSSIQCSVGGDIFLVKRFVTTMRSTSRMDFRVYDGYESFPIRFAILNPIHQKFCMIYIWCM